jgi:diguanylate cyclase (GGDEF)-like protein
MTAGLSVIWTLGLMAAVDIPLNVMTSIVPALLIIVGSTEDIHLLSEYQVGLQQRSKHPQALEFMAANMGMAVTLTFFTTALGFLSIALNRIDLLVQFGLVTAIGLLINFLITLALVPLSLQLLQGISLARSGPRVSPFETLANWGFRLIFKYPRIILSIILLMMAICFYGATKIEVNNNVMDYFEPASVLPEQAELLHRNLSGMQALSIVVTGTEGTFLQVPYLEELHNLQTYLDEAGWFDKTFSFADFIAVVHSGIDAQWPGTLYLPVRNEVVREYMSLLGHASAASFVSPDYHQARIIVRHNISSSNQLNQAIQEIIQYTDQWLDPALGVQVTGESFLNSQAVDYMADGQMRSLLLMLGVIFLLVAALFMNLKAGLIAVLANLFPIVILFGVMGYFGFALDTGTSMVGAIALGICVDHTMHFMVRYQRLAKHGLTEHESLARVMRQESIPIMATALALAMGFLTLTFSNFPPVVRFGVLSAMVMLLALIGTFVVIPLLLRNTRLITVWDLLSVKLRGEVLEQCPLFANLRSWQVRKLVVLSQIREFASDEAILLQGDKSMAMFVLLEGDVEVWRTRTDGSAVHVTDHHPGGVFGVTSMVSGRERLTEVVALQPVKVLVLNWVDVHRLARIYPRISAKLHENLSTIIGNRLFSRDMQEAVYRDEISGLYCGSFLQELMSFIVNKANRYDESLCLIIFSLQDEMGIERKYGRQALHWVLRKMAQAVKRVLRKVDLFARWRSGDFYLLLPTTDVSALQGIFVRIDEAIQETDFGIVPKVSVLIRWSMLDDGEDVDDFIARTESQEVMLILMQANNPRLPISSSSS